MISYITWNDARLGCLVRQVYCYPDSGQSAAMVFSIFPLCPPFQTGELKRSVAQYLVAVLYPAAGMNYVSRTNLDFRLPNFPQGPTRKHDFDLLRVSVVVHGSMPPGPYSTRAMMAASELWSGPMNPTGRYRSGHRPALDSMPPTGLFFSEMTKPTGLARVRSVASPPPRSRLSLAWGYNG